MTRREEGNAMEANVGRVKGMLKLARAMNQEMMEMRKRLREMDNNLRLTREGIGRPKRADGSARPAEELLPAELLARIYERQRGELRERLETLLAEREELRRLLEALDPLERQIVSMRWLDGRSWRSIAMRLYMCERNGQRIQRQAILKMARLLGDQAFVKRRSEG